MMFKKKLLLLFLSHPPHPVLYSLEVEDGMLGSYVA